MKQHVHARRIYREHAVRVFPDTSKQASGSGGLLLSGRLCDLSEHRSGGPRLCFRKEIPDGINRVVPSSCLK